MDKAARETLAARVLSYAPTPEAEVIVGDDDSSLTRFTHNAIHQNVAARSRFVRVRVVDDRRTGVVETNDFSDEGLQAAVARALEMARFAPRDDAAQPMEKSPITAPVSAAYVSETATEGPGLRAQVAGDVFREAEKRDLWAAGYITTSRTGLTIANTRGTLASFDGTDSGLNVKQNGHDSTGYAEFFSPDARLIDGSSTATVAAAKAVASKAPEAVEPGEWTVILEPPAFGEFVSYLLGHFSAQAFDEGTSFLSDGLDRSYVGDNITIRDDYAHALAPGRPFDYEGVPTMRLPLIECGVGRNVVTDAGWAAKLGRPNTGHALPAPNAYGPQAMHVVIDAGTKSTEQLIAETKRGLLVSRFWYIRPVDHRQTIVTGMTRDGTFLIEDGKIVRGVRNMRFNTSILEALRRAELSSEQRRSAGYSYSIVVPTIKVDGFVFSSGTDF